MRHKFDMWNYARLNIRMKRNFDSFTDADKEEFLKDLSIIAGCLPSDFNEISFNPGCVSFWGKNRFEIVRRLTEMYEEFRKTSKDPDSIEFREFLARWNIEALKGEFPTLLEIHVPDKKKQGIVFVHGWSGDKTSFGDFPKFLEETFDCKTNVYEYPSNWIKECPSIVVISRNLNSWVHENFSEYGSLAFIAHSMGGLVVRKLLVSQLWQTNKNRRLDQLVRQVTFIASPHNGSVLASLAKIIPGLGTAQIRDLDPNSSFLLELNSQWQKWAFDNSDTCGIRSLFGTEDKVVNMADAQGLDPEAVSIFNTDHTSIVKPDSKESPIVKTVQSFLIDEGFGKC